ncbi:MAG: hypothetical protein ACO32J_01635, partial [Phycisphaerales bacterium]
MNHTNRLNRADRSMHADLRSACPLPATLECRDGQSAGQPRRRLGGMLVVGLAAAIILGFAERAWGQTTQIVGWGYNGNGQINTPSNLTGVTQIACGYEHTYALKSDGTLVGWGWNGDGQINTPGNLA